MSKKQLVLLGIGHTNAHIVKEWQTDPIRDVDLVCISQFPTATYSGMLPGTLGEQFTDDEWRIDLAAFCERAGAKLILADTSGLDLESGQLHFQRHPSVHFDALSIGVGSMPAGWDEHAKAESMIAIKPMQNFLQRLDARIKELAKPDRTSLKVAIVGGGVASVEIAFCLREKFERGAMSHAFSIQIFTSKDRVADGMTPKSVGKIESLLSSRGVSVTHGHRVVEVTDREVVTDAGTRHSADIVIWATGAAAPPVLGRLGLKVDDSGFVATSATLQSLTVPQVFAVGDSGTVIESPSPKAGVYAVRQCPILSHNLRAFFTGGSMKRFQPQADFLKILNTGDGKALLEYGRLTAHARWCWHLKTWIDQRFIGQFQRA